MSHHLPEILSKFSGFLRAGQIILQHAHHKVKGTAFHSDHEFFKESYEAWGDAFDGISERLIGLYGNNSYQPEEILTDTQKLIEAIDLSADPNALYDIQLVLEQGLCDIVESICRATECTEGTKQLVGDEANKSEIRIYKVKQRCGKL